MFKVFFFQTKGRKQVNQMCRPHIPSGDPSLSLTRCFPKDILYQIKHKMNMPHLRTIVLHV